MRLRQWTTGAALIGQLIGCGQFGGGEVSEHIDPTNQAWVPAQAPAVAGAGRPVGCELGRETRHFSRVVYGDVVLCCMCEERPTVSDGCIVLSGVHEGTQIVGRCPVPDNR
jgi:hypothetical protein